MADTLDVLDSNEAVQRGQAAMNARRYEDALAAFRDATAQLPDNADVLLYQGAPLLALERFADAHALYTQVVTRDPTHAFGFANRATSAWQLGNLEGAFADFTQALALAGDDPRIVLTVCSNRGRVYYQQGQYAAALTDYQQARTLMPQYADFSYEFAQCYARLGQVEAAAMALVMASARDLGVQRRAQADPAFEPWLAHPLLMPVLGDPAILFPDPQTALEYTCRGLRYEQIGRHQQALADYSRAIELDPTDAHAYVHRGNFYMPQQQYAAALSDYDHALRFDPNNTQAHYGRAGAYTNIGQPVKALAEYDAALAADPHFFAAYFNRALLHEQAGRIAEALADYEHALQEQPDEVRSRMQRGRLYLQIGNHAAAAADFSQVLAHDPQNAEAYLYRGFAYGMVEDFASAHPDYEQAVRLNPTEGRAQYLLAASYGRLGRPEAAAEALAAAIRLDPAYREQARYVGDIANLADHPAIAALIGKPATPKKGWSPFRRG